MINYKLLTPGPLTTTETVKSEMLVDHCTWDEDYKKITRSICAKLLELAHVSGDTYTAVLMQGSGTFGVESVISSIVPANGCLAVLINGAYGRRIAQIAAYH
ncbi:MAG: 2-aminoethylphosphonate--pyruvate transaminase, partial [Candidatus Ornithomonoglobus sp.]